MSVLNRYPILQDYILRRYESQLDLFFFFNAKKKKTWSCPSYIGEVLVALDGKLSVQDVIKVLADNNPELKLRDIENTFVPIFDFLYSEEFCADGY